MKLNTIGSMAVKYCLQYSVDQEWLIASSNILVLCLPSCRSSVDHLWVILCTARLQVACGLLAGCLRVVCDSPAGRLRLTCGSSAIA